MKHKIIANDNVKPEHEFSNAMREALDALSNMLNIANTHIDELERFKEYNLYTRKKPDPKSQG